MIIITVELHGPLIRYSPRHGEGRFLISFNKTPTIGSVLQELEIPFQAIAMIAVNGIKKDFYHYLQDGDILQVFPHVAGG